MSLGMLAFMPGPAELFVIFMISVIPAIAFWRICTKAGYPGALGLLWFIPLANICLLLYLAFADWPVLKQMNIPQHLND